MPPVGGLNFAREMYHYGGPELIGPNVVSKSREIYRCLSVP